MPKRIAPRKSEIHRKTAETDVQVSFNLDGSGTADVATGIGFLDHMLNLFAKHAVVDLVIRARGDLHIDAHHTAEDVGISLGQAIDQAIGDKSGICRYGSTTLPMDETLVTVALDLSGRPCFVWQVKFPTEKVGSFDTELVAEFWHAMTVHSRMNFHALLHHGANSHHIAEAVFKAAARALRAAASIDPRVKGVPSTKGKL